MPFPGILLTDTFQMYEKEDLISALMVDNSERRKRQKALDIRVIIGNPPYSVGQTSANDNNANVGYPGLDERIRNTYAERSMATNKNSLYDSYIRAIRWASDRVGKSGIIGFVTNAGFVEANTADGLRKCLAEEFSSLYIFHLRGNARTQGEQRRKEKGNVFGEGSRAPVSINLFVKDPTATQMGQIHFCDIGDYLSREEKLVKIAEFKSVAGITDWQSINPDAHGDWLKQRDDRFAEFIVMGDKDGVAETKFFANYSSGLKTQRDAWCYNPSRNAVERNMTGMVDFYNAEVKRFDKANSSLDRQAKELAVDGFIDTNPTKISWTRALKQDLVKNREYPYSDGQLVKSLYRPFSKQWQYYNRRFNEMVYQMPRIFPDATAKNRVIQINSKFNGVGQIALISDALPDLHCNGDTQAFPLYLYEEPTENANDLFQGKAERTRRDAITKEGLEHFQKAYPGETISKENTFYYIYGLLHSTDYRERYADNLSKELPRIPCVKKASDFWAFSKAGRELAELHIGYETVKPYAGIQVEIAANAKGRDNDQMLYRVEKMRYGKTKVEGKSVDDKTTLFYNDAITLKGIPLEAYDYVVNGKAALDWVVERQCIKTDKDSGIVSDANAWANETMKNPKYPLELFMRVVTVSMETNKIVNGLPQLEIE